MSILFRVLGAPGRDNAALVRVDSGQSIQRLLFDCGEGCLSDLDRGEIQTIDHLLFSHLHMDHVGGFDSFFRSTFNRTDKPNIVWGPPGTAAIMQHRFRAFLWNLHEELAGTWYVYDVERDRCIGSRFEAREAFAEPHALPSQRFDGRLIAAPAYTVEALHMDHRTPSLAYIVREKPRLRVDSQRLATLGLPPGPWVQRVKEPQPDEQATVEIAGQHYDLAWLRSTLLVEVPGDSLAYLTDFILDDEAYTRLVPALHRCTTVICESQYRHADRALAERNYHMTAIQAAELARRAEVGRLVLFHLSDRYRRSDWLDMLAEARAIFPRTYFPEQWGIEPI